MPFRSKIEFLSVHTAVGKPATPTPLGPTLFMVVSRWRPPATLAMFDVEAAEQ